MQHLTCVVFINPVHYFGKRPRQPCGSANYLVSWVAVSGQEWKYATLQANQSLWYRIRTKAMVISIGSYGYEELKNVLP